MGGKELGAGGTVAEAEAALRPTEKPVGPVEPDGGDALTSGPVCFSHEQV